MKLLYIAFGYSSHTIKWVKYFRDNGHQVMLISFYPAAPIDGIDFRYIPCSNRYSVVLKVNRIKRLIAEFKPDILHAHYASSNGMVAALSGFHPFVLSVWGDDIMEFPRLSFLHRLAIKKTILRADYLTATSHMLATKTSELAGFLRNIQVIPFGVDLNKFTYCQRPPRELLIIGTVRNFTPKYGLEYLIEAFSRLVDNYKHLRLVLIGDGRIRPQLEALVRSLKISQFVSFLGAVPNDEVAKHLKEIDIFVMPSIGQGEIFGVAAVEAMATGLPVVASRVGGLPEVVDDGRTGILVEPESVDALKKGIEFYILSAELRLKHGQQGRQKVEKQYDWRQNAGSMEKLYELILKDKAANNSPF
jgi:glycosyltransferase involved in cell wall biosynthesis